MNGLIEAAHEVQSLLRPHNVPCVVIGGLAVQHWGEPRATSDVACTVRVDPGSESQAAETILATLHTRHKEPLKLLEQGRVLLVWASNGVPIDIAFGLPGYEDELIARAVKIEVGEGRSIRICSAEDLIIHKIMAGRGRDLDDVRSTLVRQGSRLDVNYIRTWLSRLDAAIETRENLQRFESILALRGNAHGNMS